MRQRCQQNRNCCHSFFFFNHKVINYGNFQENNSWKQPSSFRLRGRLRRETLDDRRIVCSIVSVMFRELTIFSAKLFFRPGFVVVREWCVARCRNSTCYWVRCFPAGFCIILVRIWIFLVGGVKRFWERRSPPPSIRLCPSFFSFTTIATKKT